MRIAILGAGSTGVCAALELAGRGHSVDLYDENPQPVTRASQNNEGKVHLGLVYAKDSSLKTASIMILGAIHFAHYLQRWIDMRAGDVSISTPFYYAVHKGTMTSADDLQRHYERCKALFADACASTGLSYFGEDRTMLVERMLPREMERLVSAEYIEGIFRTSERAIDSRAIANRLRAAVCAHPRIRFVANARVCNAAWCGTRLRISFRQNGDEYTDTYDQAANTLWHGRLEIDATLGLAPHRKWIYRYKLGGWINLPITEAVPSLTLVLGPYGDLVNLQRGLYFSWYPSGMIGTSRALKPPDWEASFSDKNKEAILRSSYEELLKRCPLLRSVRYSEDIVTPAGGVIFAWGETDIQEHDSALHTRYEIGIHSVKNYHSVNTGKYTMGPYLGYKTAERILGIS